MKDRYPVWLRIVVAAATFCVMTLTVVFATAEVCEFAFASKVARFAVLFPVILVWTQGFGPRWARWVDERMS